MRLLVTKESEWKFDFKKLKEQFPDEYELHKSEGRTDEEFAIETFYEMGEDAFRMIFGPPKLDDIWVDYYE